MSYINNYHADDSFIDCSWSYISWQRKGSVKWVVHALVANDGYLIVSCSVKAIIHGRLFLFNCSPESQWFGGIVIIRSSNSASVKTITNVVFKVKAYGDVISNECV